MHTTVVDGSRLQEIRGGDRLLRSHQDVIFEGTTLVKAKALKQLSFTLNLDKFG